MGAFYNSFQSKYNYLLSGKIEMNKLIFKEMSIETKIKGWNFSTTEKSKIESHYSADGSTTVDELRNDLNKLEKRLAEIPGLIQSKQNLATQKRQDAAYLKGLKRRKRKRWEKDHGTSAIATADKYEDEADNIDAEITSLNTEKSRLPDRIESLKKQINTLVNAEGEGIAKGIDPESAKQLGQIEVAKQKEAMQKQAIIEQKQAAAQQSKENQSNTDNQNKWIWIGGIGLLTLILIVFAILKLKPKAAIN